MSTPPRPEPSAPAAPIDLHHLDQQTCGDRELQAELLDLFARQALRIVADLAADTGSSAQARRRRADLLHLLCGSARAVGAWEVAHRAETLERDERGEQADREPVRGDGMPARHVALSGSVATAREAIARLRGHGS